MIDVPDRVRIPRRALAAWGRVRSKMKDDLVSEEQFSGLADIPDSELVALMIDHFDRMLGTGPGVMSAKTEVHEVLIEGSRMTFFTSQREDFQSAPKSKERRREELTTAISRALELARRAEAELLKVAPELAETEGN